jgi:hypothetical protein
MEIRERLPDAVIVISSVLPYHDPSARTDATGETPPTSGSSSASSLTEADRKRLAQIPEWNRLMADAAREHGVIFVDNSDICTEYEDLWDKDGIHVFKAFYPHWGKNLIVAALEEGGIADESASA